MYEDSSPSDEELISNAVQLLSNSDLLYLQMSRAVREWCNSGEMNMSNRSRNRQAWLGQAACSIAYGVPENLTKIAWRSLTPEVRSRANAVADMVISEWELTRFRSTKVLNTN